MRRSRSQTAKDGGAPVPFQQDLHRRQRRIGLPRFICQIPDIKSNKDTGDQKRRK